MNIRIVDGRLVADAEVKINPNTGNKYLKFTLANDEYYKGEKHTTYIDVISTDANIIRNREERGWYTKGSGVIVTGRSKEDANFVNGKIYLNRSLLADNISFALTNTKKEENVEVVNGSGTTNTYRTPQTAAPTMPRTEAPVAPVSPTPMTAAPQVAPAPSYTATPQPMPTVETPVPQVTPQVMPTVAAPQPVAPAPQVAPQVAPAVAPMAAPTAPVTPVVQAASVTSMDDELPF